MNNRGDLIVVFWSDITEDPTWQPIAEIEKEQSPLCKSVGWFLSENDLVVKILNCISGTDDTKIEASSSVIPKAVIRNIELIREDELDTE